MSPDGRHAREWQFKFRQPIIEPYQGVKTEWSELLRVELSCQETDREKANAYKDYDNANDLLTRWRARTIDNRRERHDTEECHGIVAHRTGRVGKG